MRNPLPRTRAGTEQQVTVVFISHRLIAKVAYINPISKIGIKTKPLLLQQSIEVKPSSRGGLLGRNMVNNVAFFRIFQPFVHLYCETTGQVFEVRVCGEILWGQRLKTSPNVPKAGGSYNQGQCIKVTVFCRVPAGQSTIRLARPSYAHPLKSQEFYYIASTL